MSAHLTAKYRPQTFARVVGQKAITRILSRAAQEGKVAPAYLLSGTRGVGKTTVARIFAKAINCLQGPGPEPCNTCTMCRQITAGSAADVVEIDGASNTGVEHVRRLKEDVGYAPLQARTKVIIIDEAHMLSKAAFNALLKTLEEPPPHATFILATTEPEKFPVTIISRCQHFVFQRLSQEELQDHLEWVLESEGVAFDPAAIRLIARRGAGSVRDAMSLLSQLLALGEKRLEISQVRDILGMVGFATYLEILEAIHGRDLAALHALVERLQNAGVDLGFLVRELTALWRDVFLVARLKDAARPLLAMPEEEKATFMPLAARFSPAHAHGAWQMLAETQRAVTQSPEPGLALELALVNLALLPELIAVEEAVAAGPTPPQPSAPAAPRPPLPQPEPSPKPPMPPSWEGWLAFLGDRGLPPSLAGQLQGDVKDTKLRWGGRTPAVHQRLVQWAHSLPIAALAQEYFARPMDVEFVEPPEKTMRRTKAELKEMANNHPGVTAARQRFQAKIVDVWPNTGGNS
jgi:DNA polymerase-3 subunit gamma/tau